MNSPPREIVDEAALREALGQERFLLFKHSRTCSISAAAFEEYADFRTQSDVATGWLDVSARRTLSQWVAESTGIRHQSPQAILFVRGQPVWNASHHAITGRALAQALSQAGT